MYKNHTNTSLFMDTLLLVNLLLAQLKIQNFWSTLGGPQTAGHRQDQRTGVRLAWEAASASAAAVTILVPGLSRT